MLPVKVFLENICHDDSLFLSVPMKEYLITNKKHVKEHMYPIMLMKAGEAVIWGRRTMKNCIVLP